MTRLTVTVKIGETPGVGDSYTDEGWHRLADAVADLDSTGIIHDALVDELAKLLPRDFPIPEVRVVETTPDGLEAWERRITHAIYVDDAPLGHVAGLLREMWEAATTRLEDGK